MRKGNSYFFYVALLWTTWISFMDRNMNFCMKICCYMSVSASTWKAYNHLKLQNIFTHHKLFSRSPDAHWESTVMAILQVVELITTGRSDWRGVWADKWPPERRSHPCWSGLEAGTHNSRVFFIVFHYFVGFWFCAVVVSWAGAISKIEDEFHQVLPGNMLVLKNGLINLTWWVPFRVITCLVSIYV